MVYGITDINTFILGTIFVVLLPGPNSLYVITVASQRGIGPGYLGACGIFVGDAILMLLAATGAASLLYAAPTVFMLLQFAGAAYLAWLGIGLIRSGLTDWFTRDTTAEDTETAPDAGTTNTTSSSTALKDLQRPFRTALIISLLNPKAIMFFISFFIQFVEPGYPYPALSFLILGTIVQISSALYLSILIFGGVQLAQTFRRLPVLAGLSKAAVGVLFIGFGLRLAIGSITAG
jgi:leucine efflux protein